MTRSALTVTILGMLCGFSPSRSTAQIPRTTANQGLAAHYGWQNGSAGVNTLNLAITDNQTVPAASRVYNTLGDPTAGANLPAFNGQYAITFKLQASTGVMGMGQNSTINAYLTTEYSINSGSSWTTVGGTSQVTASRSTPGATITTQVFTPTLTFSGGGPVWIRLILRGTASGNAGGGQVKVQSFASSGWTSDPYAVTWSSPLAEGPPTVALRNQNGDNRDRSMCLTSGAGGAAAWECGDLVVTHGLPGYATMGHRRSLTLLYNSAQAVPKPVVATTVNEGSVAAPPTVFVRLSINGVPRDSATYTGWGGAPVTRQIVLAHDGTTDTSGVYPFTLLIRNQYSDGTFDATLSDTLIVVNRSTSRYGTGWSLVGVEELRLGQPGNKILWVGGDASAKVYRSVATDTFVAAAGGFRDTIVRFDSLSTSFYRRTLRHGVTVTFQKHPTDQRAVHVRTSNRTGQSTLFTWSTNLDTLKTIQVPPDTGGTTYTLAYASGKLDMITDPASRVLDATVTNGRLASLKDPDSLTTSFLYDANGRLTRRINRRGFSTRYGYANGLRMTVDSIPLDSLQLTFAITAFSPWDEKGLNGTAAVDSATAYTTINGPRTEVTDIASFWVDRWGAPVRIQDPLGYVTAVSRGDSHNPALVTRVQSPIGQVIGITYDTLRANPLTVTDSTHRGSGSQAVPVTTSLTYADSNDRDGPSKIATPVDTTTIAYDPIAHSPARIQAQNTHVTRFAYIASGPLKGLLSSVADSVVPVISTANWTKTNQNLTVSFVYDSLGNDTSVTKPSGARTRYVRDTKTRVSSQYDPMGHRVDLDYNNMNWILHRKVYETYPTSLTFITTYGYTPTGGLRSVSDPRAVSPTWGYDAADRVTSLKDLTDFADKDIYYLDAAGDDTLIVTEAGPAIRYTYDANGNLSKLVADPRYYPGSSSVISGDTIQYTYDGAGRLLTATKSISTVTRSYNPEGTIQSERQQLFNNGTSVEDVTVRYWYDVGDRRSQLFDGTDTTYYRYGTGGLLSSLKVKWMNTGLVPDTDSFQFSWDGLGRRDSVVYRNGTRIGFGYDVDGQLRIVCANHPGGTDPDQLNQRLYYYLVDADGMVDSMRQARGGTYQADCSRDPNYGVTVEAYRGAVYDARHELVQRDHYGGPADTLETYAYDSSGNMVSRVVGSLNIGYQFLGHTNRMQWQLFGGQQSYLFTYDKDGALIDDYNHLSGQNRRSLFFNALGQMIGDSMCTSWGDFGCNQWTTNRNCKYDGLGRRVLSCAGGAGWVIYDGNVPLTGGTGAWHYVNGPGLDDPLVASYAQNQAPTKRYYLLTDGGGRLLAFTDTIGYEGGPDSLNYSQNGGNGAGTITSSNSFNHSRIESGSAPGISYYRNRYYDQQTGRFLTEDPIGVAGGENLYMYGGNNPASYTDPFGLCPYTGEKRDKNVDDCPKDKLGNAIRLIKKYGGARGDSVLSYLVAHPEVHIQVVDLGEFHKKCGNDPLTGACFTPSNDIVIPDLSHGRIVEEIGHESAHGIIGRRVSECSSEVPAQTFGLNLYSDLPERLRVDERANGYLNARRSYGSMYFDELVRQGVCH